MFVIRVDKQAWNILTLEDLRVLPPEVRAMRINHPDGPSMGDVAEHLGRARGMPCFTGHELRPGVLGLLGLSQSTPDGCERELRERLRGREPLKPYPLAPDTPEPLHEISF